MRPRRCIGRRGSFRAARLAVKAIVPVALAPEYEGRSGRLYKGGHEIKAPLYTLDPEVASRLWDATASLTRLSR